MPTRILAELCVVGYTVILNRAYLSVKKKEEQLNIELNRREELISYLAQMIDDNNVPITEFDRIALSNIK